MTDQNQQVARRVEILPPAEVVRTVQSAGVVKKIEDLSALVARMKESAHIIGPVSQMSTFVEGYGATFSVVQIDSTISPRTKQGPHCYKGFFHQDDNQRALNKTGLLLIAQSMGIRWRYDKSGRTDDGQVDNYWAWRMVGEYKLADGTTQELIGNSKLDLRDGSADVGVWGPKQIQQARAKGLERAETAAMERAIRNIGLHQTYTVEELRKPFLCIRFTFVPDMSDPIIKQMMTAHHLGLTGTLYGASQPIVALPPSVSAPPALALPEPTPAVLELPDVPAESTAETVTEPPAEKIIGAAKETSTKLLKFELERSGWIYTDSQESMATILEYRNKNLLVQVDFEVRDGKKWLVDLTVSGEVAAQ